MSTIEMNRFNQFKTDKFLDNLYEAEEKPEVKMIQPYFDFYEKIFMIFN